MKKQDILKNFEHFLKKHGEKAFSLINDFLDEQRKIFSDKSRYENQIKERQGWVTIVGGVLEDIVLMMIQKICEEKGFRITKDKDLKNPSTKELDQVRRNVMVSFGEYSLLPDGDIIIYCPKTCKVVAILSVKNSFRERYTETPYWKLKLKESPVTEHIKVFMITPDRDGEVSFIGRNGPRKARIVMEYELNGIYLAREKDEFDPSDKVKSISNLIDDLKNILEQDPCV